MTAMNRRIFLRSLPFLGLPLAVTAAPAPAALELRVGVIWDKAANGDWLLRIGWHGEQYPAPAMLVLYQSLSKPQQWTARMFQSETTFDAATEAEAKRRAEQEAVSQWRACLVELERFVFRR